MTEADDIAVARAVEEEGRESVKGVEPAPGLVHCLADVIGREELFEGLPVLEGVMPLGHRHRPRIEPGIEHLGEAAHFVTLTLAAIESYRIDIRSV